MNTDHTDSIQDTLRNLREIGCTQEEIAREADTTQPTIHRWETKPPKSASVALKLLALLQRKRKRGQNMKDVIEALEQLAFAADDAQLAIRLTCSDWRPGMDHTNLNWKRGVDRHVKVAYYSCLVSSARFSRLADELKNTLASETASSPCSTSEAAA